MKTPARPIRVDFDQWDEFGKAAAQQGTDRSAVLREFMAWYTRTPGARLPVRPTKEREKESQ
jgi:hypothetical protein